MITVSSSMTVSFFEATTVLPLVGAVPLVIIVVAAASVSFGCREVVTSIG